MNGAASPNLIDPYQFAQPIIVAARIEGTAQSRTIEHDIEGGMPVVLQIATQVAVGHCSWVGSMKEFTEEHARNCFRIAHLLIMEHNRLAIEAGRMKGRKG